mgnify:CR=1 FL=1
MDTAMMDVIGSDETIREVYHLDRPVDDFESTLAALCSTRMQVVPHIVIGLHYGRILGEPTLAPGYEQPFKEGASPDPYERLLASFQAAYEGRGLAWAAAWLDQVPRPAAANALADPASR